MDIMQGFLESKNVCREIKNMALARFLFNGYTEEHLYILLKKVNEFAKMSFKEHV